MEEVCIFLGVDWVKIYKFVSDGSGEVLVEVVNRVVLLFLLGLYFLVEDILF